MLRDYFVPVCRRTDCSAGAAPPKARASGGAAGPAGAGARAAGRPGKRFTSGVQCADESAAAGRRRHASGGKGCPSSQAAAPSSAGNVGLPWCLESVTVYEEWGCLHRTYRTILRSLSGHVIAILLHPAHHLTGARWRRTSFQRNRGSWRRLGRPPAWKPASEACSPRSGSNSALPRNRCGPCVAMDNDEWSCFHSVEWSRKWPFRC